MKKLLDYSTGMFTFTLAESSGHSSLPNDNLLEGYMAAHMKAFLVDAYVTPSRAGRCAHSLAPGF